MRQRIGCYVLIAAALLAGCATEGPTEYSAENRDAFLAACVDEAADGLFQQRICLCVYEEAESTIPFDRFLEIEGEFAGAETSTIPDDLLSLVAQCVVEEGDL